MRFPFVSRTHYDAMLAMTQAALADANAQRDALQVRLDALMDKVLTPPKVEQKPVDPLTKAIAARAGNNAVVRRHLGEYARKARSEAMDDDAILDRITHWQSSDDDGSDV